MKINSTELTNIGLLLDALNEWHDNCGCDMHVHVNVFINGQCVCFIKKDDDSEPYYLSQWSDQ